MEYYEEYEYWVFYWNLFSFLLTLILQNIVSFRVKLNIFIKNNKIS